LLFIICGLLLSFRFFYDLKTGWFSLQCRHLTDFFLRSRFNDSRYLMLYLWWYSAFIRLFLLELKHNVLYVAYLLLLLHYLMNFIHYRNIIWSRWKLLAFSLAILHKKCIGWVGCLKHGRRHFLLLVVVFESSQYRILWTNDILGLLSMFNTLLLNHMKWYSRRHYLLILL
jgi:hypothetical protein